MTARVRTALVLLTLSTLAALPACASSHDDATVTGAQAIRPADGDAIQAKVIALMGGAALAPAAASDADAAKAEMRASIDASELAKLLPEAPYRERETVALGLSKDGRRGLVVSQTFTWEAVEGGKNAHFVLGLNYVRSTTGEIFLFAERNKLLVSTDRSAALSRELFVFDAHDGGFSSGGADRLVSAERVALDDTAKDSAPHVASAGVKPMTEPASPATSSEDYDGNRTECNLCLATLRLSHSVGTSGAIAGQVTARFLGTASATALCGIVAGVSGVSTGMASAAGTTVVAAETGPAAPVIGVAVGAATGTSTAVRSFAWCGRILEGISWTFGGLAAINASLDIPDDAIGQMKVCNRVRDALHLKPMCVETLPRHCRIEYVSVAKTTQERCETAIKCSLDSTLRDATPCLPADPHDWCKRTLLLEDTSPDVAVCEKGIAVACAKKVTTQSGITAACHLASDSPAPTPP